MAGQGSKSILTIGIRLDRVEQEMRTMRTNVLSGTDAVGKLRTGLSETNNTVRLTRNALMGLSKAFGQANKAVTTGLSDVEYQVQKLRRAVAQLTANDKKQQHALKEQGKAYKATQKELKTTRKEMAKLHKQMQDNNKIFGSWNGMVKNFARTMVGIGSATVLYGLARGFVGLISQAKEFEKAIVGVAKTTDLEFTKLAELQTKVQEISVAYGNPREHVAEITRLGGQLGIRGVQDLALFTETVTQLELATNLTSTSAATSLARVLKLTATTIEDGAKRLANAYVTLGNSFAAVETEIATRTLDLAPVLGRFGYAPDVVAGFGTAAALSQVQSQSLATALNKLLIGLDQVVGNFDETNEGMRVLSGLFQDMTNNQIRTAVEGRDEGFLVELIARLREFTPLSQQSMLQVLGLSDVRTQKALYAILPLIRETYQTAIGARTGKQDIDVEVARRRQSLYNRLDVSVQRSMNALDKVGYRLLGFVTNLSEGLSYVVDPMSGYIDGILGAFGDMTGGLLSFATKITSAKEDFTSMGSLSKHVSETFSTIRAEIYRTKLIVRRLLFPEQPIIQKEGGAKEEEGYYGMFSMPRTMVKGSMQLLRMFNDRYDPRQPSLLGISGFPTAGGVDARQKYLKVRDSYEAKYGGDEEDLRVYHNYLTTPVKELASLVEKGELDKHTFQRILYDKASRYKEDIELTVQDLDNLWDVHAKVIRNLEDLEILPGGFMTEMLQFDPPDDNKPVTMGQVRDYKNRTLAQVKAWEKLDFLLPGTAERFLNAPESEQEKTLVQIRNEMRKRAKVEAKKRKARQKLLRNAAFGFDPAVGIMSRKEYLDHIGEQREWRESMNERRGDYLRSQQEEEQKRQNERARHAWGFEYGYGIMSRSATLDRVEEMREFRENRNAGRGSVARARWAREAERRRGFLQEQGEGGYMMRTTTAEVISQQQETLISAWTNVTDNMANSIGDLVRGTIELRDVFKNVLIEMQNEMIKAFITNPLKQGLGQITRDVITGSSDSLFLRNVGSLFGSTAGAASSLSSSIGPAGRPIPPLAAGGDVLAPGLALVGEKGPEFLSLPQGARVTPLDRMAGNVNLALNVNDVIDPAVFERIIDERTPEIIARAEEVITSKLRGNSQTAQAFRR